MVLLVSAIILIWGVGSLFLVAVLTGSIRSVFLKKQSIIVGDFLILPIVSGLITSSYQLIGETLEEIFSHPLALLIVVISLVITVISVIRNRLASVWWIPHISFYLFMTFFVLYFFISKFDLTSITWWLVFVGIVFHQALGVVFPKKSPQVTGNKVIPVCLATPNRIWKNGDFN